MASTYLIRSWSQELRNTICLNTPGATATHSPTLRVNSNFYLRCQMKPLGVGIWSLGPVGALALTAVWTRG